MDQSSVLLQLNLETRSHHAAADEGWQALLSDEVDEAQYIRRLIVVYGFESPLEAALAYTPHLKLVVDLRPRIRSGYIVQDLLELGLSPSELANLPQCHPIAPFASPLQALGWLYVTERATLMHDTVRQHIMIQIPSARRACSYLAAYQDMVSTRWTELAESLQRFVRGPRALDEVVAGAHSAFRCLHDWCAPERPARSRRVTAG